MRPSLLCWITLAVFIVCFGAPAVLSYTTEAHYWEGEPTFKPAVKINSQKLHCTPPIIEQFPQPLIGASARKHGGLVLHIVVAVVSFIGLAIVSKYYYVSSLCRICKEMKLSQDVVGATFMAAGSSAPQLAIFIFCRYFSQDDLGIYGVVGSSAYNTLFVVSACALTAGTAVHLDWRPFCRDCLFYGLSIIIMMSTSANGYVSKFEALFMLMTYGVYCIVLHFSRTLGRCMCCNYKSGDKTTQAHASDDRVLTDIVLQNPIDVGDAHAEPAARTLGSSSDCSPKTALGEQTITAVDAHQKPENPDIPVNPLTKPIGANSLQLTRWFISYPVHCVSRLTILDCGGRWYLFSFLISVLWISFYTYILVWMVTIIGFSLGIPDSVMGLIAVPAAVSASNAIASLTVVKNGYGDLLMANAVGSCVFYILVCLGVPWCIQTFIIRPGSRLNIIFKGFIYTTFVLFANLIILFVATLACGRKLDKKHGVVLLTWYLIFIAVASLYELNVFGEFNPPVCSSRY